ncbi:MAG TPA: hypothetical protein VGH46_09130 [Gaiellaceae bacterium]
MAWPGGTFAPPGGTFVGGEVTVVAVGGGGGEATVVVGGGGEATVVVGGGGAEGGLDGVVFGGVLEPEPAPAGTVWGVGRAATGARGAACRSGELACGSTARCRACGIAGA